jgi:hypothetical protein
MAKKRKNKRDLYTTAGRVDMRSGGRVAKQVGGRAPVIDPQIGKALQNQQVGEATVLTPTPAPTPAPKPAPAKLSRSEQIARNRENMRNINRETNGDTGRGPFNIPTPSPTPTPSPAQQQFETEREERIVRTGEQAESIAQGQMPTGAIPKPEVAQVSTGQEFETPVVQLAKQKGVTPSFIDEVGPEVVQTMQNVSQVASPASIEAARMEAAQVTPDVTIDVAQGQVSNEALAQAAGVDRVAKIDAAQINIPEGALAERVIGTLSEEAKAVAATNAGSSLARISRAKQQLSNAGLTSVEINELGNDPLELESRLEDFNEEQRGLIAGLPKEALVSNQLDSLLTGLEDGNIPVFARPAVARVEQMLAERGLEASTVGRDALVNAIIQSALPIAQSNAQAIQQSVSQQRTIEAQEAEANAARQQQTALTNARNVFQLDLAQFSADQQTALSNSKFLQTVGITDAAMDQQGIIQDAVLMSQANLAEADFFQKTQIQNAQAFLQMDMQNLAIEQQANVLKSQQIQQRLLSNQSAENAARQLNVASENQTQQFMANLSNQINTFNTTQLNAAKQFNVQQLNAAEARRVQNTVDINKANAAILNQVKQFNENLEFQKNQWNAANEQAVLNSNVKWRRDANLINTAAQNAVNQQNAQNAFNLSSQAQAFLWQELRDQADYDFRWATDSANRKLNAMIAAASSEGDAAKNWSSNFTNASSTIERIFGTGD